MSTPITQHFTLEEWKCKCGRCQWTPALIANIKRLAPVLEKIRAHFGGRPVTITPHGGHRCAYWNKLCGGAPASQHMLGTAADIVIAGVHHREVAAFARTLPEVGGVGIYVVQQFTHVDIRPYKANWEDK